MLRADERWEVLGPATYPLARLNDEWRYRIAVKTRELDALRDALRSRVLPEAARIATREKILDCVSRGGFVGDLQHEAMPEEIFRRLRSAASLEILLARKEHQMHAAEPDQLDVEHGRS